jgi:hypothetical protein
MIVTTLQSGSRETIEYHRSSSTSAVPLQVVIPVAVQDLLIVLVPMSVSRSVHAESEGVRHTQIIRPTDNLLFALRF